MYASRTTQIMVGVFALLGIAALAFLSLRLGKIELIGKPVYTIYANFDNISGLQKGDQVEIAGVVVGKVTSISLDHDRARVMIHIYEGVKIDDEAIAAIRTRGLIGSKYIAISPGPGDRILADGGTLRQTESSFVLEDAIGQLLNNVGSGGSKSDSSGKGGQEAGKPAATSSGKKNPFPPIQ